MSNKTTLEMRVLQRAAEMLGGERALARRLHVPMPDLFAWLKGAEKPTKALFLAAVDILIEQGDTASDLQVVLSKPEAPGDSPKDRAE